MKKLNDKQLRKLYGIHYNKHGYYYKNKGAYDLSLYEKIKLWFEKKFKPLYEVELDRLSKFLGVYSSDIGYAGLKDKRATTIQYISIPKKYQKEIKNFKSKKIS